MESHRLLQSFINCPLEINSFQGVYSLEKYGKPGALKDFFCTWKNKEVFVEFYWDSENFFKNSYNFTFIFEAINKFADKSIYELYI